MEFFWEKGPLFVKEMLEFYPQPRPHFNTVSTFVRGLEEKGYSFASAEVEKIPQTTVTLTDEKGVDFQSNQTVRVCDQSANDIAVLFNTRYLGQVPNDASGRATLWNDIVKLVQELERIRAVEDFDSDTVTVEVGDNKKAVLLTINGLNIVNAMSQLYMSVIIQ